MSEREIDLQGDFRRVLGTAEGRNVIWHILSTTGLYQQPYIPGEPETTAFNCGRLNVGLALYGEIAAAHPKAMAVMIEENTDVTATE